MMKIHVGKAKYVFSQSHIDPNVWSIVKGSITPEGVGEPDRETGARRFTEVIGCMAVYVDDFRLLGSDPVLGKMTAVIKEQWHNTDNRVLKWGPAPASST